MNKYLKDYLEQIDHYLVVQEGKKEILDEIKSHILEKAEDETGEVTEASFWYSMALIFVVAIGILGYTARFFWDPLLIDLIKYPLYLAIFVIVLNNPIDDTWVNFPYFDLKTPAIVFIGFLAALYTYLFLKILVLVGKEYLWKR